MATIADYIEQLQRIAVAFRRQIAPLVEMQEKMQKSLRPILEAQHRLQKSIEPVLQAQRRMAEIAESVRIPEVLADQLSEVAKPVLEFQRQLDAFVRPAFADLAESFRKLPKQTRNALLILGAHGWFLDLEMPLPGLWELEKALKEGNVEDAEQALVDYFRERLPEISERLATEFPPRRKILKAAFDAHARGEYELSIPVFLAQADGICQELVGVQLFKRRRNKPATSVCVEALGADTFRCALLCPLAHPLPISFAAHERGADFGDLNRHQVLHGESVDYGTEINSFKAISLLNYINQVLRRGDVEP